MKKRFTLIEYILWLLGETTVILFLFNLLIDLVISYNLQTTFRNALLVPVIVLGSVYLIIKIFSKIYLNNLYLSMLPISYLLGFYLIQFQMFLDNATKSSNYTDQLALFTLFFIVVNIIDKIVDNFLVKNKEK